MISSIHFGYKQKFLKKTKTLALSLSLSLSLPDKIYWWLVTSVP
jgi:hypothetical protein